KVLAVEAPLSLQVHPDADQARAGFAREQGGGRPAGDPSRSYHDDQPKPELICALTPFEALAGFREPAASAELLRALNLDRLRDVIAALDAGELKTAVNALLAWPSADRHTAVEEIAEACRKHDGPEYRQAADLAGRYPG